MSEEKKVSFILNGFLAYTPDAISYSSVANLPGDENPSYKKHRDFFAGVKSITGHEPMDKETIEGLHVRFEIPQIPLDQVNQINQLAKQVGFKIKWPNPIELFGQPKSINGNELENTLQ
jgi:hypothetical protein